MKLRVSGPVLSLIPERQGGRGREGGREREEEGGKEGDSEQKRGGEGEEKRLADFKIINIHVTPHTSMGFTLHGFV
jgi:hypothetical protein